MSDDADMGEPMILSFDEDQQPNPSSSSAMNIDDLSNSVNNGHHQQQQLGGRKKRTRSNQMDIIKAHSHLSDHQVKIALSLYKVQQNIYLLDFQRVEVCYVFYIMSFLLPVSVFPFLCLGRCIWVYEIMCFHYHGIKESLCCLTKFRTPTCAGWCTYGSSTK